MGRITVKITVMFTRTKMKFLTSNLSLLRRRCIKVNVNDNYIPSLGVLLSLSSVLFYKFHDRRNFNKIRKKNRFPFNPFYFHLHRCNARRFSRISDISLLGDTEDSVPEQTSVTCLLRSHDGPATTTSTSPIRQSPSVRQLQTYK